MAVAEWTEQGEAQNCENNLESIMTTWWSQMNYCTKARKVGKDSRIMLGCPAGVNLGKERGKSVMTRILHLGNMEKGNAVINNRKRSLNESRF